MEKLKGCPFCGGKAEVVTDRAGMTVVRCTNIGCKVSTRLCWREDVAVSKWNTRAKESE